MDMPKERDLSNWRRSFYGLYCVENLGTSESEVRVSSSVVWGHRRGLAVQIDRHFNRCFVETHTQQSAKRRIKNAE